jgi:hypothetical protein
MHEVGVDDILGSDCQYRGKARVGCIRVVYRRSVDFIADEMNTVLLAEVEDGY